jgi:BNR repeat-like domain
LVKTHPPLFGKLSLSIIGFSAIPGIFSARGHIRPGRTRPDTPLKHRPEFVAPQPDAPVQAVPRARSADPSSTKLTMTIRFCFAVALLDIVFIGQESCCAFQDQRAGSLKEIDLDSRADLQVVVDREKGVYLGHPSTMLLEDGKTILCAYPKGHGKGEIVLKRSDDGGKTWTGRLPVPENWSTSLEVPTLHRVVDPNGKKRVILFSGLYPARMAVSEDDGKTWSDLVPLGDWGGIVVMGSVIELAGAPGRYLAMFHDDGRFFSKFSKDGTKSPETEFTLYQTLSVDGGLSWSFPESVYRSKERHLCEPGLVRSPDGKQIAAMLRENSRQANSMILFSSDEGASWSTPREMPDVMNGDRHTARYSGDGRLLVSFRAKSPNGKKGPFEGDWVAWCGKWDDLVDGSDGQYLIRLKDNHHAWDCGYPGVEILPDGTFVITTYGHWQQGESPYVMSVRFPLEMLDSAAK